MGNVRGIRLKSCHLSASSATAPSTGQFPGWNLPFGSQFFVKQVHVKYQVSECRSVDSVHTFRDSRLTSSIPASWPGWKFMEWVLDKNMLMEKATTKRVYVSQLRYSIYDAPFFFPFRLSAFRGHPRSALSTSPFANPCCFVCAINVRSSTSSFESSMNGSGRS